MKITKIFAENIKTFPRLDLHLEGYTVTLISGSNGAGKTTAFVTIPMISFYSEFAGHSIKDYSLPSKDSKIGIEFEYENQRYMVMRQFSGESSKSLFIGDGKRITKAKEIELQIERIFGMDRETFLSTVVIAQGEVETLSERSPRERRELFLRFLDVDFKKAYEKAKKSLDEIMGDIEDVDRELQHLNIELQDKPLFEKKIPQIGKELEELEENLTTNTEQKNNVLKERNRLNDELGKLRERLGQSELLSKRRSLLEKDTEEFMRRTSNMNKEKIKQSIEETEDLLHILEQTYPIVDQRNNLSRNLLILKEIVKNRKTYDDPGKLENKIEQSKEYGAKKEKEKTQMESQKTELLAKKNAASIYIQNIEEYSRCPICNTQLSKSRQPEVIKKIEDEIKSIPDQVIGIEKEIETLEEEISKTKKELVSLTQLFGESKRAYAQIDDLLAQVDIQYRDYPEDSINRIEEDLHNLDKQLKVNIERLNLELPPSKVEGSLLIKRQSQLNKVKDPLQKAYDEYAAFESKLIEIKKIDEELNLLKPIKEKIEIIESKIQEIDTIIVTLDGKINNIHSGIGSKKEELTNANQKLQELYVKEKLLNEKKKDLDRFIRKRDILYIIKEHIFKDNAFPTIYLKEFVHIVQANLSDFISRFKGGRYEIDMDITDEGDIEVRARDRSKMDTTYRPLRTFSQGERTIIGFAVRLATMRSISQYKGKNMPNILIIDEGFGPLDQENIRALVDGIKELASIFEQIFIITHIEQLKEDFDQRLIVEETPNGSVVRAT